MEKLIVKNFGPIKEAEINLTKYVVFIGDTSTGKSVLGKLISIFRDVDFSIKKPNIIKFQKMLDFYNIDFNFNNSFIEYNCNDYNTKLENNQFFFEGDIVNDDSNDIDYKRHVDELLDSVNKLKNSSNEIDDESKNKLFDVVKKLITDFKGTELKQTIYFPAERILNSIIGSSISGLWANNIALPSYFKNFSAKYEVARMSSKSTNFGDFGFKYYFENEIDKIVINNNKILLTQASSGIQSLIPLLLVLDYSLSKSEFKIDQSLLIEEPELNLFPIKQKTLIDYIVKSINDTNDKIVFTTHSPYILSSLDTLILAKNTFNEHPNLKEEISNIVSEDKWIDYQDISVYEVRNDGKVYSIKNEEYKSIDSNTIDRVSDVISDEFDKLTELRYAHKH